MPRFRFLFQVPVVQVVRSKCSLFWERGLEPIIDKEKETEMGGGVK